MSGTTGPLSSLFLRIKHALYSGELLDDMVLESTAVPTYLTGTPIYSFITLNSIVGCVQW